MEKVSKYNVLRARQNCTSTASYASCKAGAFVSDDSKSQDSCRIAISGIRGTGQFRCCVVAFITVFQVGVYVILVSLCVLRFVSCSNLFIISSNHLHNSFQYSPCGDVGGGGFTGIIIVVSSFMFGLNNTKNQLVSHREAKRLHCTLTFRHRASCLQDRRFTTLQRTLFVYLINIYISLSDIFLTAHH